MLHLDGVDCVGNAARRYAFNLSDVFGIAPVRLGRLAGRQGCALPPSRTTPPVIAARPAHRGAIKAGAPSSLLDIVPLRALPPRSLQPRSCRLGWLPSAGVRGTSNPPRETQLAWDTACNRRAGSQFAFAVSPPLSLAAFPATRFRASSMRASSSSSGMSFNRLSLMSNSFGNIAAITRRYSCGRSARVMRIAFGPFCSKSSHRAATNLAVSLLRDPLTRPPVFSRPGSKWEFLHVMQQRPSSCRLKPIEPRHCDRDTVAPRYPARMQPPD